METEDVVVGYVDATSDRGSQFKAVVEHRSWSASDVARQMYERLRSIDEESRDAEDPADRTDYSGRFNIETCEKIVSVSLERANVKSGRVVDANRQRLLQALGTLRRKSAKRVVYTVKPGNMSVISTTTRPADSVSAAELRRGSKTIFFTDTSQTHISEDQQEFFLEATDPDGDLAQSQVKIGNSLDLKTPLSFVIADATPERRFVRELSTRANALALDAWIKNASARFYSIEYAWKKGEHPKRGEFSPDFFIMQGNLCIVVEIKSDDELADPAPENVKKHQFARQHFLLLNKALEEAGAARRYHFTMLTPRGYNTFFQTIRDRSTSSFLSELDVILKDELDLSA